jgi:DNA (cytosine-5)-methyltransferase 1
MHAEFPAHGKTPRAAYFDGRTRGVVSVGNDPLGIRPPSLVEFLRDIEGQQPLSLKATLGFLSRTERAKLRFEPGFLEAVRRHAAAMGANLSPMRRPAQMELLEAA